MRLFVAVPLDGLSPYFQELQEAMPQEAARMRMIKDFHVTLKFIGEVDGHVIEHIQNALRGIRFEETRIRIGGLDVFKDWKRITVAWLTIEGLESLCSQIEGFLSPWVARTRITPHLTLARVKNVKSKKDLVEGLLTLPVRHQCCKINHFYLLASELTPQGPVYSIIEKYDAIPQDLPSALHTPQTLSSYGSTPQ